MKLLKAFLIFLSFSMLLILTSNLDAVQGKEYIFLILLLVFIISYHFIHIREIKKELCLPYIRLQEMIINNYNKDLHDPKQNVVDLRQADFRGANLKRSNLKRALLSGAIYDKNTIFPDDFDPVKAGMKEKTEFPKLHFILSRFFGIGFSALLRSGRKRKDKSLE